MKLETETAIVHDVKNRGEQMKLEEFNEKDHHSKHCSKGWIRLGGAQRSSQVITTGRPSREARRSGRKAIIRSIVPRVGRDLWHSTIFSGHRRSSRSKSKTDAPNDVNEHPKG
jgi:hypothetical protein